MAAGRKAGFHQKEHTWQSGPKNGKLESQTPAAQPSTQPPTCPLCHSNRVWKDGLRSTRYGDVQRYICRQCGRRFSDNPKPLQKSPYGSLNTTYAIPLDRQICVSEGEMKNLAKVETRQKRAAGATKPTKADVKGKMVTFLWELKKQGLKDGTIRTYHYYLRTLSNRGADLLDPESIKEAIANQEWSENTRALAINAYSKFLEVMGGTWQPPKHGKVRKLPFIPLESELDQLISGAYRKLATFLQVLKETGMRSGEAWRSGWTDIDFRKGAITLNQPEKGGSPRMFKVSSTLIAMLNALPKKDEHVFQGKLESLRRIFRKYRKRMAAKLQNPRLKNITFHTFRHWKATMEYSKTKDILYVMKMLGHKDIKTTLIYTQLVNFESNEFHSATARTIEEAEQLIEAGFEYVCTYNDTMLFRKRK